MAQTLVVTLMLCSTEGCGSEAVYWGRYKDDVILVLCLGCTETAIAHLGRKAEEFTSMPKGKRSGENG
ncbi:MAG: hypothetical protein ACREQA_17215 [Candidatus Binatia bacterium]